VVRADNACPVNGIQRARGYRYSPTSIALAYRWATLVVGLLIALVTTQPLASERVALFIPIVVAAVVSGIAVGQSASRFLVVALAAEVAVAAVVIWVTGHYDSPLILYLTAPVVHAALVRDGWLAAGTWTLAVFLFMGVVALDPGQFGFQPAATVRDVALLIILPVLVFVIAGASDAAPSAHRVEVRDDDRAIALELLRGRTYKEIADDLSLSPESVKVRVSRLYRRLGARDRQEALRLIDELDLVSPSRLVDVGPGPAERAVARPRH
jgi:DNA-binding CsgD family transcriptional regulator